MRSGRLPTEGAHYHSWPPQFVTAVPHSIIQNDEGLGLGEKQFLEMGQLKERKTTTLEPFFLLVEWKFFSLRKVM